MQANETLWKPVLGVAAGAVVTLLVPQSLPGHTSAASLLNDLALSAPPDSGHAASPLLQLCKLTAAALVGFAVTLAYGGRRRGGASLDQAQAPILLCVAGALMTIVIGNSLPRALGLVGGASIIRFRTPVKDPRNATILFALLGLGAACGLGAFTVAATGSLFLCLLLALLDRASVSNPRTMLLELVSGSGEFPSTHVQDVFARHGLAFEAREYLQGSEAVMKYNVTLAAQTSLKDVSAHLLNGGAGLKSVAWQTPKKEGDSRGL